MYLAHVESTIWFDDVTDFQDPISSIRLGQADPVIACDDFVVDGENRMGVYSDPGHLDV